MAKKREKHSRSAVPRPTVARKLRNWEMIRTRMLSSIVEPQNEKGHRIVILKAYAAVAALERGHMDYPGFLMLNFMNAFAYCLYFNIREQGSEALQRVMVENIESLGFSSDALAGIGQRHQRVGRYGVTGSELQRIRDMVGQLDRTAESAPLNVIVKSLRDAQGMVDDYLGVRHKEVA